MIRFGAVALTAVELLMGRAGAAEGAPCAGPLDAAAVVRCALESSPEIREAREQLAAISARRISAGLWLPSNPVLAATGARRTGGPGSGEPGRQVFNWSVTLSQEIEVAGQRRARLDVVDAAAAAQVRRVAVGEQDVAAQALAAYYQAVAAQEGMAVARLLVETGERLARAAEGRAAEALIPGVDADVARAEATRLGLARFEAERRVAATRAALTMLVGAEIEVRGALPAGGTTPLPATLESDALRLRGELAAAEMERRVLERQLALTRRERIPRVTLSAFAQNDGFDERVLGAGISIPLPLPTPVGHTGAGEIAETLARLRAADSSLELVRRRVRLEVAQAVANLRAREAALGLFRGDLLARARRDLVALGEAMTSRQLSLREALVAQRSLIELLASDIEARLAHAEAWVELRRVAGLPLSGGGQP
jgi:cobalt-zinc-cadmium efflux system outer membrane protein